MIQIPNIFNLFGRKTMSQKTVSVKQAWREVGNSIASVILKFRK